MSSKVKIYFGGKLDKDAKDVWIAALRSGEFKQGAGKLKHGNQNGTRYCCLGVACEIFPGLKGNGSVGHPATFLDDESCAALGLTYEDMEQLAALNDGDFYTVDGEKYPKHNFNQIADIIEERL